MTLYLVRHGDALPSQNNSLRPLSKEGQEQVTKLAQFMDGQHVKAKAIYHSGILRAQQTAETLASVLKIRQIHKMPGLLPEDPIESLTAELKTEEFQNCILVGHLPYMDNLLYALVGHVPQFKFNTGAGICLECEKDQWIVSWFYSR